MESFRALYAICKRGSEISISKAFGDLKLNRICSSCIHCHWSAKMMKRKICDVLKLQLKELNKPEKKLEKKLKVQETQIEAEGTEKGMVSLNHTFEFIILRC